MNSTAVKEIYDKLHKLESKLKPKHAYPIHKRLNFEEDNITDIYEWLSQNIVFKDGGELLDAGCGVGYGSCLLASNHNINVQGITLSAEEVRSAQNHSQQLNFNGSVSFEVKSFDNIAPNKYDTIIAVESLKHSFNLENTLKGLQNQLNDQGQLIIVEDFYTGNAKDATAIKYKNSWSLIDVFKKEHYIDVLKGGDLSYIDITDKVNIKGSIGLQLKIALFKLSYRFQGKGKNIFDVARIFEGGFYLDLLFSRKQMNYGILIWTKE